MNQIKPIKKFNKKMKKYITILATIFAINLAYSQGTVKGKITDSDGVPIFGATISFTTENSKEKKGTISQDDGYFSFKFSEEGDYKIEVSYIGMTSLSLQKYFTNNQIYDLKTLILQEGVERL